MNTSPDQLAQRLGSAIGAELVAAGEDGIRVDGMAPALIAAPQSSDQVRAIVRLCGEARAAMIPWGGGTAMALGDPPRRADVLIKLDKLARVIDHDAANLTVSAESGVTLAALQSALAPQKQFSPLDAPFPHRSTLGGVVAANLNGPSRSSLGSVRDLVIGIKAVLASGELIKGGGKVVKNVAGYDMSKLFVGSLGTLGIITEATVRVAPIPETCATLLAEGSLAQAEELNREIGRSALIPFAVQLRSSHSRSLWQIGVRCEGFGAAVERQLRELEAMGNAAGMRTQILSEQAHSAFCNELRDFPLSPGRVMYRATLPRSTLFVFLASSSEWNPSGIVCDATVGTIWLAFPEAHAAVQRFTAIDSLARQQRGHAMLFAAPAALKTGVSVWGPSPPSLSIMREIKRQFDPAALLNPGRFIGGL
jgi:glycolate oxidase FAD binding subunit